MVAGLFITTLSALCFSHKKITPPHVHGEAQLQLAIENEQVSLNFSSPIENFLGFERAPKNEIEQQQVKNLIIQLNDPSAWFELSPNAQCHSTNLETDAPLLMRKQNKDSDKYHSDLRFDLEIHCKNPQQLNRLYAVIFKHYKGIKRLKVNIVHGDIQSTRTLQSNDPIIAW